MLSSDYSEKDSHSERKIAAERATSIAWAINERICALEELALTYGFENFEVLGKTMKIKNNQAVWEESNCMGD